MSIKTELMLLIMLECRLSLKTTEQIFKISEEEIKDIVANLDSSYKFNEGLKYLLYFETIHPDAKRDERAKFKAIYFIRRANKILNNPNLKQRKKEYEEFIATLTDAEFESFIEKTKLSVAEWPIKQKNNLLKFRLRRALPMRVIEYTYNMQSRTIIRWINKLPEGEFKTCQQMLNDYSFSKINEMQRRRK